MLAGELNSGYGGMLNLAPIILLKKAIADLKLYLRVYKLCIRESLEKTYLGDM